MPKVSAQIARSEKRKAATEREKRRMERVNEQLEALKSIVCPNAKSLTKSKILDAALERIIYLEQFTSGNTCSHSLPVSVGVHSVKVEPVPSSPEYCIASDTGNQSGNVQFNKSGLGSPENSTHSWDSGYSPVDYTQQYSESSFHSTTGSQISANSSYDFEIQYQEGRSLTPQTLYQNSAPRHF